MLSRQEDRTWGDTPRYPDFAESEYDHRLSEVKKHMEEQDIDALVLWDENNIRYFSGFHNLHWQSRTLQCAVVLIPLAGDPHIIVPDFFGPVVEGYSYYKNILLQGNPHCTKNIRNLPVLVTDAIKDIGCGSGRIGIEAGEMGGMSVPRPINDIDLFRASLEEAEFVDAADAIWKCRVIKSAAEVDALRIASQAVVNAYGELVDNFQLGMTERELGLMVRKSILDHVEDCNAPFIISSGRQVPMADVPPFDNVAINVGDRVILEPLPTHKGYFGSCGRVLNVGPPTDEGRRKSEYIDSLQQEAINMVKPGASAGELMDAIVDQAKVDGVIDYYLDMAGHGVGLSFQEPPAIAIGEKETLEEGMVLAIECWAVDFVDDLPHCYAVEDYVLVTKGGCESLPGFDRDKYLPI